MVGSLALGQPYDYPSPSEYPTKDGTLCMILEMLCISLLNDELGIYSVNKDNVVQ